MKSFIALFISITLFSMSLNAQDFQFEKSTENVKKVKATIKSVGGQTIVVPDDDENMRYVLTNLPDEYKVNGLQVQFSGILGIIPPNIRMIGSPVKLTKIKACPGFEDLGVKTKSYSFE